MLAEKKWGIQKIFAKKKAIARIPTTIKLDLNFLSTPLIFLI
jgi:hypothetical protein